MDDMLQIDKPGYVLHIRRDKRLANMRKTIERIREILLDLGYDVTRSQTASLWEQYSEHFGASWLVVDDDTLEQFREMISHGA